MELWYLRTLTMTRLYNDIFALIGSQIADVCYI